jgi:hypothetical protein
MTKPVAVDRPISSAEITVIQVMLQRAAVAPEYSRLQENLNTLRVVWRCECGCDGVDFNTHDPQSGRTIIADGTGETPSGNPVDVIIWGSADSVTGIEICAGRDDDLRLPTPESIRAW